MQQIITLGGGGFSIKPDNPLLDTYILKQAHTPRPRICFLPTASGDADNYITRFYDFFNQHDCEPTHLSLFNPPTRDIEGFLLSQDILYVGGGNTKNLLALWKDWGLVDVLRKAWEQGIILAGLSAGAICWFEEGVTDSFGDGLEPIQCLGFLKGSSCPHYDGDEKRRPAYHHLIENNKLQAGIAMDDGVAVHYKGQEVYTIVSSRAHAKAYHVHNQHNLVEEELPTIHLGNEADNTID